MSWIILFAMSTLFGGCCLNVLTLESMMKTQHLTIGGVLTFCQFLVVTLEGLYKFGDIRRGFPFVKPIHIPLRVYIVSVLLYYVSSVANNSVFNYGISVPLHIVFRSSGTVFTMIMSWILTGRSYSRLQIFSAFLLTTGAILTSVFKDSEIGSASIRNFFSSKGDVPFTNVKFLKGISLLALSSFASSSLSVYTECVYREHGKHWKENMFYTHALSLPLFLTQAKELWREFMAMGKSNQVPVHIVSNVSIGSEKLLFLVNILSQQACIKGVNLLASRTNALTLSVTLLFRKFLSLLLSFYMFGNELSVTCCMGIATVFSGALIYAIAPNITRSKAELKKDH